MKMLTLGCAKKDIKYCSPCEYEAVGKPVTDKKDNLNFIKYTNEMGYIIDYTT